MNRDQVKTILSTNGFLPESKFGQNFLCDEYVTDEIIDISTVSSSDKVLEIGPGIGALTCPLGEISSNVTAIEIDKRLAQYLDEEPSVNAKIISSDYLKLSANEYDADSYDVVLSNIPYYVMTPIIKKLICDCTKARKMTFMIEEEALNRIVCDVKSKQYGPLAVIMRLYGEVKKEFSVPSGSFYPAPNTLSCVISLTKNDKSFDLSPEFMSFVEKCFAQRRKKLLNNLQSYNKEIVKKSLNSLGISETARAEELYPETFIDLYNVIINKD